MEQTEFRRIAYEISARTADRLSAKSMSILAEIPIDEAQAHLSEMLEAGLLRELVGANGTPIYEVIPYRELPVQVIAQGKAKVPELGRLGLPRDDPES